MAVLFPKPLTPRRRLAFLAVRMGAVALLPALFSHARLTSQTTASNIGCTLQNHVYRCNWAQFKAAFDSAHTVGVQTGHIDRQAAAQLQRLVTGLGKAPVAGGAPADLTFLLIPVDATGVDLGPADHDLATLRIYAPSGENPRGALLWAETYRGQGDQPWPAVVHSLLDQFKTRMTNGLPGH